MTTNDSYLKRSKWGKPALSLLKHMENINPERPAILMLRHSERDDITDDFSIPLNKNGLQAAYEFGLNLPTDFSYSFYYSQVVRCKETADQIKKGLQEHNGNLGFFTELKSLSRIFIDGEEYYRYLRRDKMSFVYNWIAGHYPPWIINLSQNVAHRIIFDLKGFLENSEKSHVCICTSHDLQVTATLFHLAGVLSTESYIQFMDGFILQVFEDKMRIFHKYGIKEEKIPFWWDSS